MILLIDDNADILTSLLHLLERCNVEAIGFVSPNAVNVGRMENVDAVVCDFDLGMMSDKNGVEVIEALRKAWPDVRYAVFSGLSREVPEGVTFIDKSNLQGLLDFVGAE